MDRACAFLFLYILLLEICTKDVGFICLHGLGIGRKFDFDHPCGGGEKVFVG